MNSIYKKYFSKDIKYNKLLEKPLFYLAIEKRDIDIIKLLFMNKELKINAQCKKHYYFDYNSENSNTSINLKKMSLWIKTTILFIN